MMTLVSLLMRIDMRHGPVPPGRGELACRLGEGQPRRLARAAAAARAISETLDMIADDLLTRGARAGSRGSWRRPRHAPSLRAQPRRCRRGRMRSHCAP